MNFIVVGYMGQYGSMGQWVADILRQNGHEVEQVDRKAEIPVKKAIYFFVDCSEDYSSNIPDIPYPKIFWSLDIHMPGGLERATNIASKCDLVLSSNYEHGKLLFDSVGVQSYLIPITYREDYFKNTPKNLDIAMIGNANSQERVQLWNMLTKYNSYGGSTSSLKDYTQIMSSAKIIVNQPTEPWDIIVNNRFFEGLGANSLLLQKRLKTDLIEKMGFVAGQDFLYWNSLDELPSVIEAILENYDSYRDIIKSGNKKVKAYEMKVQMRKIQSLILDKFYDRL